MRAVMTPAWSYLNPPQVLHMATENSRSGSVKLLNLFMKLLKRQPEALDLTPKQALAIDRFVSNLLLNNTPSHR